jgi:hypothetical protein
MHAVAVIGIGDARRLVNEGIEKRTRPVLRRPSQEPCFDIRPATA